ncbi:hypothetical protein [Acinetobacter sp. P8-3-8]|uniref:hypothetical protein n=1 Tax=Acinetobacter sp. P8-3-8 TaxID=1029823 RepID=UPI0002485AEB|nr:hypothetical protein [Acinetobacter sp. P8-3-8]
MKKIIFCISSLFACTSLYAVPNPTDQFCQLYAITAAQIMMDRQSNTPKFVALNNANKSIIAKSKNSVQGLMTLVDLAYQIPIAKTQEAQKLAINTFADTAAERCFVVNKK